MPNPIPHTNENPFTITFGKRPQEHISRIAEMEEIIGAMDGTNPMTQAYMISGVRGSGKTVLLADIAARLREEGWIVIDLNPTVDMLQSLASRLYDASDYSKEFIKAKLNLSALGIGVAIEEVPPISDYETAIARMLGVLKKKNKRVIIVIDEVSNTLYMRQLVSAFQILVRNDYPVYLLMTGLYNNLYNLQNSNEITFLLRTPKMILEPLKRSLVRTSYQNVFGIDAKTAQRLAAITCGYPFAYQVLGYLYWSQRGDIEALMPQLDQYLQSFVYEKIWSELSEKDRQVIGALAEHDGKMEVKTLREQIGMSSQVFSVYRQRVKKKGLIDVSQRGYVSLQLPRFDVFAREALLDAELL